MVELETCPVCGGPAAGARCVLRFGRLRGGKQLPARLVQCSCGHVFSNPQPTRVELAPFYGNDYHVFADQALDDMKMKQWIASRYDGKRFNHAAVVPGGRYLDVGCGLGEMVSAMMRLGMEAQGVKPSPIAARLARNSGLKVFCGMLSEARFADDSFDCISLYHVLEHTPNPIEVLRECRRILKPDGEIVVGVPNFESMTFALIGRVWGGLDPPRHLQHFRPASITRAAGRAGLAVAAMETESLVEHVERELVGWLRQRLFVPARLMLAMGAVRPLAAYLARKGNASNRGEAIVVHLRKNGSW